VVVLGGATLAPVYSAWARRSDDPTGRLRALLDDTYGDRIPGAVRYGDPLDPALIERVGPTFLAGVARRSRVVVAPDVAVAAAVRLDVGPDEPVPDVRVGDDADVVRQLLPDS
jgi:hypothetical protein